MRDLADRLDDISGVNPRGVALAKLLLEDGGSALYGGMGEEALAAAVAGAVEALEWH
jgi:hypothetical protein